MSTKKRSNNYAVAMACAVLVGLSGGCVSSSPTANMPESTHNTKQTYRDTARSSAQVISGPLSLDEAVLCALQNNQALKANRKNTTIAKAVVLSSCAGFLPKVTLYGGYTRIDDDLEDSEDIGGILDQYEMAFSFKQPLFRGGASVAERDRAKGYMVYVQEEIRDKTEAAVYAVISEYYNTLLASKLLEVADNAVSSAEAYLENVIHKQAGGTATEYAVLRAKVDVSLYEAEKLQQQNRLNMARTRLLQRIGVSQQSDVQLTDELTYKTLKPDYAQAVQDAELNRPDIQKQQADIYMCMARVRKARSRYYPKVDAVAEQSWGRPDPHMTLDDEWGSDHLFGVQVELPLFDGLIRESDVAREKAALEKSLIMLEDLRERAILDVQQAVLRLRDAEQFVQSQKMNQAYAHEGLRLADVGYAEGVYTEIDVTDARAALTKAQGLHYEAIYGHKMAVLLFRKAVGLLVQEEPAL